MEEKRDNTNPLNITNKVLANIDDDKIMEVPLKMTNINKWLEYNPGCWIDEYYVEESCNTLEGTQNTWLSTESDLYGSLEYSKLCALATIVQYDKQLAQLLPSADKTYPTFSKYRNNLVYRLNTAFDTYLGELKPIYDYLDVKHNTDKWVGDVRYQLLSNTINKGCCEMSILKNTVALKFLFDKHSCSTITYDVILSFIDLSSNNLYWEFGHEYKGYNLDKTRKEANECRVREIAAQNEFVEHVLHKRYNEAMKLIAFQLPENVVALID